MGGAILKGWLSSGDLCPNQIVILDPNPGDDAIKAIDSGAMHIENSADIPSSTNFVLLSIKPQLFKALGGDIAKAIGPGRLIVSIMAGVSSTSLSEVFSGCQIVRAMPNTPASIGKGITGYVANADMADDEIQSVEALLGAIGAVVRVETDEQIDAVTAISGSGPAYIFHLCEAMAQAGTSVGLSEETAMILARATIIGAAGLMDTSDLTAADLRQAVTSPNGTTEAALEVLMGPDGFAHIMEKATRAAKARAEELSV